MSNIKCPKCGTIFKIDDSDFQSILSQVRTEEFEKEIEKRIKEKEENLLKAHNLELDKEKNEAKSSIDSLNLKIKELESINKSLIENKDKDIQLEVTKAEKSYSVKINSLNNEIEKLKNDKQNLIETNNLKLENFKSDKQIEIIKIKNDYENKLKESETQVAYYKDLKTRLSTKLVGESLEQHCSNEFDKYRTLAFPNAEFHKDNKRSEETSSKGDFIFRDFEDGVEYISIMFEMKNDVETTKGRHKNEDFLKELDKDRNEKNCEYAVLVSLLEPDNDFYNTGIADVSYVFPKMFVVRPQCFLTIISLLKSANKNALEYKKELLKKQQQDIDLTNFEDKLNECKTTFTTKVSKASKNFDDAIANIDKSIKDLESVKEKLLTCSKNLNSADKYLNDITIRKLTSNSKSILAELKKISDSKNTD